MPKYEKTNLDTDIERLLSKASKRHLSPEDHQKLTDLVQQLADLDDNDVDDGVDMDLMWALVAKAAKHRLSKTDRASFRIGAAASPDQEAELAISIPAVLSVAVPFDTSEILAEIPKTDGKGIKSIPFLVKLAKGATANPNGRITVFPKPIFFTTNKKKIKAIPFKPFSTMTQFTKHPCRDAVITLGLVLVWTAKPVTMSMKDWAAHDHHANLLFLVHHPNHDGPGKAIVIGEPNVFRNTDRTQRAILESRMKEMVNSIKKDGHSVWVNKVWAERNSDGKCLELVLRWMVDLVIDGVDGLEIERDTAGQVLKMKDFLPTPP
ncbi:hypothetical protein K438DRAFT_1781384 [Mycena galopus ATCC 62051]|nr:hypothetical protein K438DRAFT_1781384 [Mycena galopus ATCC 62051]